MEKLSARGRQRQARCAGCKKRTQPAFDLCNALIFATMTFPHTYMKVHEDPAEPHRPQGNAAPAWDAGFAWNGGTERWRNSPRGPLI
jgi:hypothetical protein